MGSYPSTIHFLRHIFVDHERALDEPRYAALCRRAIGIARADTIGIIVAAICKSSDSGCKRDPSEIALTSLCQRDAT
jgi:hypothetical protein